MPVLLLALTGLDRAAVKACTALGTGLLLALAFAISSLAAILGAGSAATPASATAGCRRKAVSTSIVPIR